MRSDLHVSWCQVRLALLVPQRRGPYREVRNPEEYGACLSPLS
jgi:hypothetical protein